MIRINNISLSLSSSEENLLKKVARILGVSPVAIKHFEIVKKAVDARNKKNIFFIYTLDVAIDDEEKYLKIKNVTLAEKISYKLMKSNKNSDIRPIVIGAGPAGLFAALILSEAGMNPIIIERGYPVSERTLHVDEFFKSGKLNPQSNVQFGEGGAGTFSDGKLTTGIKDFRIQKVMDELITLGAPKEIKYLAKPHIGTDKLADILVNIRKKIESLGGEYRFNTQLVDINIKDHQLESILLENIISGARCELDCRHLILATGHSARDTFEMLEKKGLHMEGKPFSVGLRIEHKQSTIDKAQYGEFWNHPKLSAADYKMNVNAEGRGVYTFCMCPGGQVVAAASE
ncbi:MAG: NAD(P)/FAD-dependent oxidoreductase, partial [Defluviitaleaceae bacterium]|nr:NAD(P)/FAD-dependent oxidoreductase [Defluviitaleaceae bacterium]